MGRSANTRQARSQATARLVTAAESWAGPAEIRALLAEGANVDGIDGQANWPLVVAAYSGYAGAVWQLLFWGADVTKARTDYGWKPLYLAAKRGPSQAEVVRLLLDGEPDVNKATTDTGSTPLYKAAKAGHAEMVRRRWMCGSE